MAAPTGAVGSNEAFPDRWPYPPTGRAAGQWLAVVLGHTLASQMSTHQQSRMTPLTYKTSLAMRMKVQDIYNAQFNYKTQAKITKKRTEALAKGKETTEKVAQAQRMERRMEKVVVDAVNSLLLTWQVECRKQQGEATARLHAQEPSTEPSTEQ